MLEHRAESLLALAQGLLGELALGDVLAGRHAGHRAPTDEAHAGPDREPARRGAFPDAVVDGRAPVRRIEPRGEGQRDPRAIVGVGQAQELLDAEGLLLDPHMRAGPLVEVQQARRRLETPDPELRRRHREPPPLLALRERALGVLLRGEVLDHERDALVARREHGHLEVLAERVVEPVEAARHAGLDHPRQIRQAIRVTEHLAAEAPAGAIARDAEVGLTGRVRVLDPVVEDLRVGVAEEAPDDDRVVQGGEQRCLPFAGARVLGWFVLGQANLRSKQCTPSRNRRAPHRRNRENHASPRASRIDFVRVQQAVRQRK
ncbi:MAG: hypothetical protein IPJ34_22300 [Myxococcales bacterium]|nr:hypothetical protein [Myxococcales bacterium]